MSSDWSDEVDRVDVHVVGFDSLVADGVFASLDGGSADFDEAEGGSVVVAAIAFLEAHFFIGAGVGDGDDGFVNGELEVSVWAIVFAGEEASLVIVGAAIFEVVNPAVHPDGAVGHGEFGWNVDDVIDVVAVLIHLEGGARLVFVAKRIGRGASVSNVFESAEADTGGIAAGAGDFVPFGLVLFGDGGVGNWFKVVAESWNGDFLDVVADFALLVGLPWGFAASGDWNVGGVSEVFEVVISNAAFGSGVFASGWVPVLCFVVIPDGLIEGVLVLGGWDFAGGGFLAGGWGSTSRARV